MFSHKRVMLGCVARPDAAPKLKSAAAGTMRWLWAGLKVRIGIELRTRAHQERS